MWSTAVQEVPISRIKKLKKSLFTVETCGRGRNPESMVKTFSDTMREEKKFFKKGLYSLKAEIKHV